MEKAIVFAGSKGSSARCAPSPSAALQDVGQLVRVPHGGGSPTVLTSVAPFSDRVLAQTETHLLWSGSSGIQSIPKSGGSSLTVVPGIPEPPAALATDATHVYWLEPSANRIRSAPLTP